MSERTPPLGLSLPELTAFFSGTGRRDLCMLARRAHTHRHTGAIVLCREPDNTLALGKNRTVPKNSFIETPSGRGDFLLNRPDIVLFVSSLLEITEKPMPYNKDGLALYRRIQQNNPTVRLIGGTLGYSVAPEATRSARPTTSVTLYTIDAATNTPAPNIAQLLLEAATGMVCGGIDSLAQLYPNPAPHP